MLSRQIIAIDLILGVQRRPLTVMYGHAEVKEIKSPLDLAAMFMKES